MSAGTAYTKRYAGGFADLPSQTTAIDSTFLNAVETALLQLLGQAPSADGQVMQWDNANTRYGPALLLNKNIDAAAAISKSKLDFTGANGIVNADVAGAAAIARSKLDFGAGLVNSDIASNAAIALSKIAMGMAPATTLPGSPSDGQLAVLTDSTTAPTYAWLLQYSTAATKWFFLGGTPLRNTNSGSIGVTSTTYVDFTNTASITLPRAGNYVIWHAASFYPGNSASAAYVSPKMGGNAAVDGNAIVSANLAGNSVITGSRYSDFIGALAADVVKLQGRSPAGTININTFLQVEAIPVWVT